MANMLSMAESSQQSGNPSVQELDDISRTLVTERVNRATAIAVGPNPSLSLYRKSAVSNWIQPKPIFHQLCSRCAHIVQTSKAIQSRLLDSGPKSKKLEAGPETFSHYPKLGDIAESASQGCHLGPLLRQNSLLLKRFTDQTSYVCSIRGSYNYSYIALETRIGVNISYVGLWASLRDRPDPGRHLVSFKTDSDETFSCAKDWLSTCLKSHQMCKLCLTEGLVGNIPYLTLSHCWGGANILQLTKDKLKDFIISIPLEDLPQTLLDAVVIMARLRYEYIWIDSLCIIQDSEDGRKEEVETMNRVYRNSVLTIAALHATNSTEGYFTGRNPMELMQCRVKDGDTLSFHPASPKDGPRERQCPSRPMLHKKGWVVQEGALSPRTLYYSSQMIFLECIQCNAFEAAPEMENVWRRKDGGLLRVLKR